MVKVTNREDLMHKRVLLFVLFSLIVAMYAGDAHADKALGFKLGYLSFGEIDDLKKEVEKLDTKSEGFFFGAELDRSFTELLYLSLEVDYYSNTKTEKPGVAGIEKIDLTYRLIPVTLNAKLRIPLPLIVPYAGVGVGAYWSELKVSTTISGTKISGSDSFMGFGYQGLLGAELDLSVLGIFLEYQYRNFSLDYRLRLEEGAEREDVKDNVEVHQIALGVLLKL